MASGFMAFLHHLFAFILAACLVYEFVAFRKDLSVAEARRIQRMDLVYGVSAGLLVAVGLLRVFSFEKGASFYMHSPFFWVKMATFILVALLSIDPTLRYLRWNKILYQDTAPRLGDEEYRRTRLLLGLELAGLVVILLAAALMARGIGMN